MSPPVISPYKKWFIIKRIVQTFFGGPKLVLSCPVIFFQTIIYLVPAVIICVVNALVDSNSVWEWKAGLSGVGILLSDVTLTFLIWILKQRKDANITPEQNESIRTIPENFVMSTPPPSEEEEEIAGGGWFRSLTWKFIAPNVNMSLYHFSALIASAISTFLAVAAVADPLIHPVLKGFVIFTVCNARYSSVISAAPEVATFDPVNRRHLFYRSFYVALCAGIYVAIIAIIDSLKETEGGSYSEEREATARIIAEAFVIMIALLPLVWLSGMLPPLDALFPWFLETMLSAFGGKSIGYTYFGTSVSLVLAMAGPLASFILSQEPKVTFLLECLCGYIISCDTGSMPKLKASLCEDVPVKYFLQQLVRPAVTIICSLLSIFIVVTTVTQGGSIPDRDIYHPVLASISIFLLLTTKLVQMFDVVHRKRISSRLALSIFAMWHGLLTLLLHVWLTFELSTEYLEMTLTKSLETVVHSLNELLPCILTVRFFALAVTEPHDSTIDILATYLYQSYLEMAVYENKLKFVVKLFIISLVHSVVKRFLQHLRMIIIFTYATFTSTLLDRRYIAGAAIFTVPLTVISLVVSSFIRGMNLVPLFTLPIFTIGFGFPRPQSFWKGIWFVNRCAHNETQKIFPMASSIDWTIYADTSPLLVYAFTKHCEENKTELEPGSCFIARYDDRLIFLRVISSGWKFCYLQVKGLEIQEQTSCHYQEAAWLDEIFDKYLRSNTSHIKRLCSYPQCLVNSLEPKFCLNVPSYSESKSQIPHLISGKGKTIFRDMFFRAFSYLWIKGNPAFQGESYRRPIASGVPLGKGYPARAQQPKHVERSQTSLRSMHDGNNVQLNTIAPDMNGNRATQSLLKESQSSESIMSGESIRGASAPMRHHPQLKDVSSANWQGSVSYPLIPGLPNFSMEGSDIDRLPAVGSPSGSNEDIKSKEINNESISPPPNGRARRLGTTWDGLPQFWMKQCVGDAIPYNAVKARVEKTCWKAWEIAFGTLDDLYEVDMARFYRREFAKCMRTASFHEKPDFDEIAVRAFRYATKLTLDEIYTSGIDIDETLTLSLTSLNRQDNYKAAEVPRSEEEEQDIFQQLCSFEKTFRFCCYDEVPYWMNDKAKHIVSISADGDKNILRIFNYQSDGVEFAVGELSKYCVEGIWASLNTELLYLTSDDDERYSIQHNKYLLRNICAQSAQTLGYPVYEAIFRVNLFDFSLEQLSS